MPKKTQKQILEEAKAAIETAETTKATKATKATETAETIKAVALTNWRCQIINRRFDLKVGDEIKLSKFEFDVLSGAGVVSIYKKARV